MLFLWTTTKHGKIWIDGDSFKQIVAKKLPSDYYCQELSFIGEKNLLNIYITVPENASAEEKCKLEDKLNNLFAKSGILLQTNWVNVAPQDNPKTNPLWMLPLFWAGAAAAVTAIIQLGIKGILWTLFASIIGYGVSWIFLTEDGQKQVTRIMQQFRR